MGTHIMVRMVSNAVKIAVTATIDEFLDQMALSMEDEHEWSGFLEMLERRRIKLRARLVNGKG